MFRFRPKNNHVSYSLPPLESHDGISTPTSSSGETDANKMAKEEDGNNSNEESKYSEQEDLIHTGEEVRRLIFSASRLARMGREEEALKNYNLVLAITGDKIHRTQEEICKQTSPGHTLDEGKLAQLCSSYFELGMKIGQVRTMMSILHERNGDYDLAIDCGKKAKELFESQLNIKQQIDERESSIEELIDKITHMLQRMERAQNTFEARRALHLEVIEIRKSIATAQNNSEKHDLYGRALDCAATIFELETESLGQSHPQLADTLSLLSSLYSEVDDNESAIQFLIRAVSITRVSLGPSHPKTGEKLREIARLYESVREDDLALICYREAGRILRKGQGYHLLLAGGSLNDMAVIHIRRGQYDDAIKILSTALKSLETVGPNGTEVVAETVQVWRNFGECHLKRREWHRAAVAFSSALNIQLDMRKMLSITLDEKVDKYIHLVNEEGVAHTLQRLAKARVYLKQYKQAIEPLEKALQTYRIAATEFPDEPDKKERLAFTLHCLAEVKEATRNYPEALKLYKESLKVNVCIMNDIHDVVNVRENQLRRATTLCGIGSVYLKMGCYYDALASLKEALWFCKAQGLPDSNKIVQMIWNKVQMTRTRIEQQRNKTQETKKERKRPRAGLSVALADNTVEIAIDGDSPFLDLNTLNEHYNSMERVMHSDQNLSSSTVSTFVQQHQPVNEKSSNEMESNIIPTLMKTASQSSEKEDKFFRLHEPDEQHDPVATSSIKSEAVNKSDKPVPVPNKFYSFNDMEHTVKKIVDEEAKHEPCLVTKGSDLSAEFNGCQMLDMTNLFKYIY